MARSVLQFVRSVRSLTARRPNGERGQVIMLAAVLAPLMLGMCAMAVDVGSYAAHRRNLQNDADAIALAAARDLPSSSAAQTAAQTWATKDGVNWSDVTFAVIPQGAGHPNPEVSVTISVPHSFAFMGVLGVSSRAVGAKAVAVKTSPPGMGTLVPWSVTQSTVTGATSGQSMTMKYDSNGVTTGNFGILALDGTGASTYEHSAEYGSTAYVCAQDVTGCTTSASGCSGSVCSTEPGNKVGSTRNAVDYRTSHTDLSCDTFAEVFTGPTNGQYGLNPTCNPWLPGSKPSLRVIVVPVTTSLCNGSCNVTITGFALFFLDGYGSGGCTGNNCEVQGRFVQTNVTIGAAVGTYDGSSDFHFTRLTQ